MGLFKRMFQIGKAEANAVIDKLEDPIKMTEQGIKNLKKDLDKSLQSMAEVKAVAIRTRKEMNEHKNRAQSYEHKAIQLLQKAQGGGIAPEEADRLATEALNRKEESASLAITAAKNYETLQTQIQQLEGNVNKLKSTIGKYENELKTLKARARVSEATKKLNKSMAQVDSSSTIALLERMKEKVDQEEAMAEAYGEMALSSGSLDDEINNALDAPVSTGSLELEALKAKLNKQKLLD